MPSDKHNLIMARGALRRRGGGEIPGIPETPKFWLAIGTTIDNQPGIYKSLKQQTILCLATQIHTRLMGTGYGIGSRKLTSYSTIVLYSRNDQGWWAWSTKKSTLAHLQESFMAT